MKGKKVKTMKKYFNKGMKLAIQNKRPSTYNVYGLLFCVHNGTKERSSTLNYAVKSGTGFIAINKRGNNTTNYMNNFSAEQALAICTANLASRIKARTNAYTLYYANDKSKVDGQISGFTIKQLINEFRALGRSYKLAFITKRDDNKVLRFYNADMSNKFFSMTRKARSK